MPRQSQHHGCQLSADVDIAKNLPNFSKHRYASNEPTIMSSKHAFFERVFIHTNCGLSRYAFGNTAVDNPYWPGRNLASIRCEKLTLLFIAR
jgi:hypothetical protein